MHDFLDHLPRTTTMPPEPRRLHVRLADPLQREQIIWLDKREPDAWGSAEIYRHCYAKNCYVKEIDLGTNATVGPVLGYLFYEQTERYIHINRVRIAADHRRLGLGRTLIEHIKGRLTENRPIAEMMVNESDLATQCFLRSCGFICINTFDGYYGKGRHARDAYAFRYIRPGFKRSFMQDEGK